MVGSRVASFRVKAGIRGYESATKDGQCLTMYEAALQLGVSSHVIRRLITEGLLPARQVVSDAPWQILSDDLKLPAVQEALRNRKIRPKHRGIPSAQQQQILVMTETGRSGAE